MVAWFSCLPAVIQALIATLFTWGVTALGASAVFFVRQSGRQRLNDMLGLSAGIMIAATFWSLLSPAIEMAERMQMTVWLSVTLGFGSGCILIYLGNYLYERILLRRADVAKPANDSNVLMIAAVTLHNIPEGMAIGVAFGSLVYQLDSATLGAACLLALGIGIQNFPEGLAVSMPLLQEGYSKRRAFFMGQLSGMVEPLAGIVGAALVLKMRLLLPYLLAFAAGAMLYVVIAELIPKSQKTGKSGQTMLFTMIGFMLMMALDLSL